MDRRTHNIIAGIKGRAIADPAFEALLVLRLRDDTDLVGSLERGAIS